MRRLRQPRRRAAAGWIAVGANLVPLQDRCTAARVLVGPDRTAWGGGAAAAAGHSAAFCRLWRGG